MKVTEGRVSVDSCVFVNVLIGGEPDHPKRLPAGTRLFKAAERAEFRVVISALTIAEVVGTGKIRGANLPSRDRHNRTQLARAWMQGSSFMVVEIDRKLAMTAAELAVEHQLRGPDAVILASAIRSGSSTLYTWDQDLLKVDGRIAGIRVLTPDRAQVNDDLFDAKDAQVEQDA